VLYPLNNKYQNRGQHTHASKLQPPVVLISILGVLENAMQLGGVRSRSLEVVPRNEQAVQASERRVLLAAYLRVIYLT
jgi:hypothetical protein